MKVWMNRTSPSFDLDMEILATIPPDPSSVSLSAMTEDFNLEDQSEVRTIIERLRDDKNFGVYTGNRNAKRVAFISEDGWEKVLRRSQAYWDKVYGGVDLLSTQQPEADDTGP